MRQSNIRFIDSSVPWYFLTGFTVLYVSNYLVCRVAVADL